MNRTMDMLIEQQARMLGSIRTITLISEYGPQIDEAALIELRLAADAFQVGRVHLAGAIALMTDTLRQAPVGGLP
jgi:hypothetical protein